MGKNQATQTIKSKNGSGSRVLLPDRTEEVARLAYQFYVDRGCEHGHDQEDWLRAEATVGKQKGQ
jgi:hypothetical protein